jgi:hypothetical protein
MSDTRWPSTRIAEIEKNAQELVDWVDAFVEEVIDIRGCSLVKSGEWDEVVSALRKALRTVD